MVYSRFSYYGSSKLSCENIISSSVMQNWVTLRIPTFASLNQKSRNSTLDNLINSSFRMPIFLPLGGRFCINYVTPAELINKIEDLMNTGDNYCQIIEIQGKRAELSLLLREYNPNIRIISLPMPIILLLLLLIYPLRFRITMFDSLLRSISSPTSCMMSLTNT